MKFMSNLTAFGLIWINAVISGLNIYFSLEINTKKDYEEDIKEKLIIVECVSVLFIILLVVSFSYQGEGENKRCCLCCTEKCLSNCAKCDSNNNSSSSGGGGCAEAICIIIVYIIMYIVLGIFIIVCSIFLACGKNFLRLFSTGVFIIFQLAIIIMSLIISRELNSFVIVGISSFGIVCNLLANLLPNFCGILSYKDETGKEEQNETQISNLLVNPQISNNEIQNNNEIKNFDDKEQNKNNNTGPLITNESESGYSHSANIYGNEN